MSTVHCVFLIQRKQTNMYQELRGEGVRLVNGYVSGSQKTGSYGNQEAVG